jgi:hypothetical protein
MTYTNDQMDAAIVEFRSFKTADEYYARLAGDPNFKAALEAAYQRGQKDPSKNFTEQDAQGWRRDQYCVSVPPAPPRTTDFREDLATEQNEAAERRRQGLPIRPPKRMQFVIPYID